MTTLRQLLTDQDALDTALSALTVDELRTVMDRCANRLCQQAKHRLTSADGTERVIPRTWSSHTAIAFARANGPQAQAA